MDSQDVQAQFAGQSGKTDNQPISNVRQVGRTPILNPIINPKCFVSISNPDPVPEQQL